MTRTRALIFTAGLALLIAVTAGITYAATAGSDPEPAPVAATPAPTRDAATEVECVNIRRAHNAWAAARRAKTAADFASLNRGTVRSDMDAATAYHHSVAGYDRQAAKDLAVSTAQLAAALAAANATLAAGVPVATDQAAAVESAIGTVARDYEAWRQAACA